MQMTSTLKRFDGSTETERAVKLSLISVISHETTSVSALLSSLVVIKFVFMKLLGDSAELLIKFREVGGRAARSTESQALRSPALPPSLPNLHWGSSCRRARAFVTVRTRRLVMMINVYLF